MYASGKAPKKCSVCKVPLGFYGMCDQCKAWGKLVREILGDDSIPYHQPSAAEQKADRLAIHRGRTRHCRDAR